MIEKVELLRLEQGADGTFGVLRLNGCVHCVTLEPPDRDNEIDLSSIPEGKYVCRRVESPRFGHTYEVTAVPGRSHILLHPGNVVGDTQGCILLGRHFGLLRGNRAVLNSGQTFAGFMKECDGSESFPFIVENIYKECAWNVSA